MNSSLLSQISYAFGIFALATSGVSVRTYINFLYTDILGLSGFGATFSWGLFCIVSAIAEPFIGYMSDKMVGCIMPKFSSLHLFIR
jgi:Na+/melibiose symporter-like transporter